jgi:hypothetical protein
MYQSFETEKLREGVKEERMCYKAKQPAESGSLHVLMDMQDVAS